MPRVWPIPRHALIWILIAQFSLLPAHYEHVPWWALLVYFLVAVWRIMLLRGNWQLPSSLLKTLFVLLCLLAIVQQFDTVTELEAMVTLLLLGFALKLLECRYRRDVYFVLFLAYLVAASAFLFSQQIVFVIYLSCCFVLITAALVALHQTEMQASTIGSLHKAVVMILQALPLTLVLFLVLPRFSPLWSVPTASHQGMTGMSETMSPGDISRLGRSDQLVMRAEFEGQVPPLAQLYWRGLILSAFDGRTWRQSEHDVSLLDQRATQQLLSHFTQPLHYQLIVEPHFERWIFALPLAMTMDADVVATADSRLLLRQPMTVRTAFKVQSDLDAKSDTGLSAAQRLRETALPATANPLTRQWAQTLYSRAANDADFVRQLLAYFSSEDFFYTLTPPLLGRHSVDEFLFESRHGFCEHYASSFVFALRSVGIPARVVAGYQGGDINPLTRVVSVRQFDAHAWAEVWLGDAGWVRVDPTAAVSPLRVEAGLQQALSGIDEVFLSDNLLSPHRYRHVGWFNQLRLRYELLNYNWTKSVLNYRGQLQVDTMRQLLGEVTAWRIAALVLSVMLLLCLPFIYGIWSQSRHLQAHQRLYLKTCGLLAKRGLMRLSNEAPAAFAQRVAQQRVQYADLINLATQAFIELEYEDLSAHRRAQALKQLRRQLLRLRLRQFGK